MDYYTTWLYECNHYFPSLATELPLHSRLMLTLEYLAEGSDACPLIRLYGFEKADVVALHELCIALAERRVREAPLEDQPWVRAIGGCRLTLRAGDASRDADASAVHQSFVMEYTSEGWLEVAEKLEPLIGGSSGFQWLANEGELNVLISRDGHW